MRFVFAAIAFLTLSAALAGTLVGCSTPKIAPSEAVAGTGGTTRVLVFTAVDCPIANAYAPELARLAAFAKERDLTMILVYPDPSTTVEAAQRHVKEYAIPLPVCCDPTHELVRVTGATVTPEAAVIRIDDAGAVTVLYRGRIDNHWAGIGQRRAQTTSYDLRDAMEAVAEGREPKRSRTQAIGCTIEPVPGAATSASPGQ
ncbi:MAG: redoxin family protein [Phycisphaerae bacterium]|nr:redoxin family protein [Phycisphaerae bacterium]